MIRHAHAGDRERWTAPDELRPLSEKGHKQAEALAGMLPGVERILSSRYLRCRQTVEPLALRLGRPIQDEERLVEGTRFSEVLELITAPGPTAAMCTHGDIIVSLVDHLLGTRLVSPAEAGSSKASTWELEIEGGAISSARYIPPPA